MKGIMATESQEQEQGDSSLGYSRIPKNLALLFALQALDDLEEMLLGKLCNKLTLSRVTSNTGR